GEARQERVARFVPVGPGHRPEDRGDPGRGRRDRGPGPSLLEGREDGEGDREEAGRGGDPRRRGSERAILDGAREEDERTEDQAEAHERPNDPFDRGFHDPAIRGRQIRLQPLRSWEDLERTKSRSYEVRMRR